MKQRMKESHQKGLAIRWASSLALLPRVTLLFPSSNSLTRTPTGRSRIWDQNPVGLRSCASSLRSNEYVIWIRRGLSRFDGYCAAVSPARKENEAELVPDIIPSASRFHLLSPAPPTDYFRIPKDRTIDFSDTPYGIFGRHCRFLARIALSHEPNEPRPKGMRKPTETSRPRR